MTNSRNQPIQATSYASHQLQASEAYRPAANDLSPAEVYALFEPRFGADFAEWFVGEYKRKLN